MRRTILWSIALLLPATLFLAQSPLTIWRFNQLGCRLERAMVSSQTCDSLRCTKTYEVSANQQYLVLGHIIAGHSVFDGNTGKEILPVTQQTTLSGETWPDLYVYRTSSPKVIIAATYPSGAYLNGFSGILPRSCSNSNVLAVPSIAPTINLLAHILLAIELLVAWLGASLSVPTAALVFNKHRRYLQIIVTTYLTAFLLGTHFFDALHFSATGQKFALRILASFAPLIPLLGVLPFRLRLNISSLFGAALLALVLEHFPTIYLPSNLLLHILAAAALVRTKQSGLGIMYFIAALEIFGRITGFRPSDLPPLNTYLISLGTYGLFVAWRQGAASVLPQVKRAYDNLLRDIAIVELSEALRKSNDSLDRQIVEALKAAPRATDSQRVALLLLKPDCPPMTYSYDSVTHELKVFRDGKIPGAIFTRVLLYRQELWFTSVDKLKAEGFGTLKATPNLNRAEYFCALPLLQGQSVVGAIALTRFKDDHLKDPSSPYVRDLSAKITLVVKQIEAFVSGSLLNSANDIHERSVQLSNEFDKAAVTSLGSKDFLLQISQILGLEAKCSTLIFQKNREDKADLTASYGLSDKEIAAWREKPLNLNPQTGNKIGPFIVAFNEGTSSYIRDISEIFAQLHPHSVKLLVNTHVTSIVTIPVVTLTPPFVIILFSRGDAALDPMWRIILSDLRHAIAAHYRAIEQRSATVVLGRLTMRLVGDEQLRTKLIEAAQGGPLPSTVGNIKSSFLFVPDIVNSSSLSDSSPDIRAEKMGLFYNAVQLAALNIIGAYPRKMMGDSIILTSERSIGDTRSAILQRFAEFGMACDQAAREIGADGARLCIHYGEYFCGMIGTSSSASIDVMGTEIDRVCKLESVAKEWKKTGLVAKLALTQAVVSKIITMNPQSTMPAPSGCDRFVGEYFLVRNFDDIHEFSKKVIRDRSTHHQDGEAA